MFFVLSFFGNPLALGRRSLPEGMLPSASGRVVAGCSCPPNGGVASAPVGRFVFRCFFGSILRFSGWGWWLRWAHKSNQWEDRIRSIYVVAPSVHGASAGASALTTSRPNAIGRGGRPRIGAFGSTQHHLVQRIQHCLDHGRIQCHRGRFCTIHRLCEQRATEESGTERERCCHVQGGGGSHGLLPCGPRRRGHWPFASLARRYDPTCLHRADASEGLYGYPYDHATGIRSADIRICASLRSFRGTVMQRIQ